MRNLDRAWEKVRSNGGCSGGDGVTVSYFQGDAGRRIARLSTELRNGDYHPSDLRLVDIPKAKGGVRRLQIPSIVDRVVHTALAQVLSPILEPHFEDGSYAYRPGRSVQQAVNAIDHLRKQGFWHVVEADIVGFFDAIRHDLLVPKLEAIIDQRLGAGDVLSCIDVWLGHTSIHSGTPGKGLAQGSPLSPLLANLYLDTLDETLVRQDMKIIRFADDFVVLCKQRSTAAEALIEAQRVLSDHALEIHEGGTRILDFDRGFEFLGKQFVRSFILQSVSDPEEDVISLLRGIDGDDREAATHATALAEEIAQEQAAGYDRGDRILYLNKPGRRLDLRNMSFCVENADGRDAVVIAHNRVDRIEVGPSVDVSPMIFRHALATNTPLHFVTGTGASEGWLEASDNGRAELQFAQAEAILDPAFRLAVARKIVAARIRNQRTQLFRLNRRQKVEDVTRALASTARLLRKLEGAHTLEALRGLEGAVAAEYWPALGLLCAGAPSPLRRSRPATDALNAAINYFIGILQRDIRSAVQSAGLHTGFGLLHDARDRSDAAVYDVIEPFRAPLTEGLAVFLFNARRLDLEDFQVTESGCRIDWNGRRAIIASYEQSVAKRVNVTGTKSKLAWRPLMLRQARDLARACRRRDPELFTPYLMEA